MEIIKIKDTTNKLFYIGGVVRDEILGKKSFDIDLTYVGNAIEYAKKLDNAQILKINEPFGTVRIKIDDEEIDIASTRKEIYERVGHLPTITTIGCSLKDDVLRRDFTINALAKNFNTGEIIDYTGGLNDIKNKTLKVLHDKSFIEDPTRIIRALKFAIRFDFHLDEHSQKLRDEYLQNINYDMSFKRVKKELIETFNLNSQKAYNEFIDANIYKLITTKNIKKSNINIEYFINKYKFLINPANIWLIYVGTLEDLSNLPLTKEENNILESFKKIKYKTPATDYETYNMFRNVPKETVLLYGIMTNELVAVNYLENLRDIKLEITGKDLQNLGIKPSPEYKKCFEKILEQKCYNFHLKKMDEIILAKEFFKK